MNPPKQKLTFIQRTTLTDFHELLQEHYDMGFWMLDFSTCFNPDTQQIVYTAILSKEVPA